MQNTWLAGAIVVGATVATAIATARAGSHHDVKADRWRIERPVVSSYWPDKGEPRTKVVIRGENFFPDTSVMWGSKEITGAHVAPTEITFTVPKDAKSGRIALRHGDHVELPVGTFEVARLDPVETKRAETEREHAAEAAWKAREKSLAKDRAAREADLTRQEHELETTRDQRREKEAGEVRAKWQQPALYDPDVQAELTLHAERMADLERMDRLAAARADGKLVVRVEVAMAKENDRHDQRMTTLQAAIKK